MRVDVSRLDETQVVENKTSDEFTLGLICGNAL